MSSIVPEAVHFPKSKTLRTTNNSTSLRSALTEPVPEPEVAPTITETGRRQVIAQTLERVAANLEVQNQRQQSLPPLPESGRSSPSLDLLEEIEDQGPEDSLLDISLEDLQDNTLTDLAALFAEDLPQDPQTLSSNTLPGQAPDNTTASTSNLHASQNQTQNLLLNPITMVMDRTKLPDNYGTKGPKFSGSRPETLKWYLEVVEDLIKASGATADSDKKWIALRYCDTETKEEWEALVSAAHDYSYAEFKDEIIENYPECREAEEGSLVLLDKFVKTYRRQRIEIDDASGYKQFTRKFRALTNKLLSPVKRISNRELAARFIACCSPELAKVVRERLRTTAESNFPSNVKAKAAFDADAANKGKPFIYPVRLRDDKYVWTDIMDMCTQVIDEEAVEWYEAEPDPVRRDVRVEKTRAVRTGASGHAEAGHATVLLQGSADATEKSILKQVDEKLDAMSREVAEHLDKVTTTHHKEMAEIKEVLVEIKHNQEKPALKQTSYGSSGGQRSSGPAPGNCYYCGEPGHFINDCQTLPKDIEAGVVKVKDSRTLFFDGKNIPREPRNKTQALKAREYYDRRFSQQYLHDLYTSDYVEQYSYTDEEPIPGYDSRADELRTLKAEKETLRQFLLKRNSGSKENSYERPSNDREQSQANAALCQAMETMGKMQSYINSRYENSSYIQTRNGAGQANSSAEGF